MSDYPFISHLPILRYRVTGASLHPRHRSALHLSITWRNHIIHASHLTSADTHIAGDIAYEHLPIILPLYYGLSSSVSRVVEDFGTSQAKSSNIVWTFCQTL